LLPRENQSKQTTQSLFELCRSWSTENDLPALPYWLKCAITSLTFLYSLAASDTQMSKCNIH